MSRRVLASIAAVLAIFLLFSGAALRWWFHGTDGRLSIDFGLWDIRACGGRGCTAIAYAREWIDNGWRSPDAVAAFERMLFAARFTLAAALGTSLALVACLVVPRDRLRAHTWSRRLALILAAAVVLGAVIVLTHRPTFQDPDMQYFSMRTGLGGGITIAGAVLAGLAAWRGVGSRSAAPDDA